MGDLFENTNTVSKGHDDASEQAINNQTGYENFAFSIKCLDNATDTFYRSRAIFVKRVKILIASKLLVATPK